MIDAASKAAIMIEALPWLERYVGKTMVIKYGGNAMIDESLKAAFAQDIVFLRTVGVKPVVVHGGGPQISSMLKRLGIASEFRGGLRVTTPEAHGPLAVGLSGEDAGLLTAERKGLELDGEEIDLGLVGEVTEVRPEAVLDLINAGRIPVVATVAPDEDGQVHNVNADTAAGAIAAALGAERLIVLTDVAGLYADWPNSTEVIRQIGAADLATMLPGLAAGMIPKMEACLSAVLAGVPKATVIDGRVPHSLLLEIFTDEGIGTMVLGDSALGDPAISELVS